MENDSFYICSLIFVLLAIITATGKVDALYCKKYAPGFKNGKFTWRKQINYNPKRMRPLTVVMFVIIGLLLLAVPVWGFTEQTMGIVIISVVVVYSIIALKWAVEKE